MAMPRSRPARTSRRTVAALTVSSRAADSYVSRSGAMARGFLGINDGADDIQMVGVVVDHL